MDKITVRPDGLLTPAQAAALCGVSVKTIYRWTTDEMLPVARRYPRRIFLNPVDVLRADAAIRAGALRRGHPGVPEWEIDGDPDADFTAILLACHAQADATPARPEPSPPVVYYIRFGDRIKIGTTSRLLARMRDLPKDELLVTEPGGRDLERQRHREFAAFRVTGEWFKAETPLLVHIARLRASLAA